MEHEDVPSLLPCPFCGKTNPTIIEYLTIVDTDACSNMIYERYKNTLVVVCPADTMSHGSYGCGATGGYSHMQTGAAINWNTRFRQKEAIEIGK